MKKQKPRQVEASASPDRERVEGKGRVGRSRIQLRNKKSKKGRGAGESDPGVSREDFLQLIDGVNDRCDNIRTLARLLASSSTLDHLGPQPVRHAGIMIEDEIERLQALFRRVRKGSRRRGS